MISLAHPGAPTSGIPWRITPAKRQCTRFDGGPIQKAAASLARISKSVSECLPNASELFLLATLEPLVNARRHIASHDGRIAKLSPFGAAALPLRDHRASHRSRRSGITNQVLGTSPPRQWRERVTSLWYSRRQQCRRSSMRPRAPSARPCFRICPSF